MSGWGGEYAEASRKDVKVDGDVSGEFAVDFDGDGLGAADGEAGGLEVFDVLGVGVAAHERGADIAGEAPVAGGFEEEDVEFAVVQECIAEEGEGAAIAAAVADEGEGASVGAFRGLEFEERAGAAGELGGGEEVGERAEAVFAFGGGGFDDLCIDADAGELDEVVLVGASEVDLAGVAVADDLPRGLEVARDAEFVGEDVHGADGEDAEGGTGEVEAVDDVVDAAVATGGDDGAVACGEFCGGEIAAVTWFFCDDESAAWESLDACAQAGCPEAASVWVKDDGYFLHAEGVIRPFLS